MSNAPVSETRLKQIATDACDHALQNAESYVHSSTEKWNNEIIQAILKALISETTVPPHNQPNYKYAVNSTIIQHTPTVSRPADSADSSPSDESSGPRGGRRGMHSASGAFWNNEKDGMWSFKYEAGEKKGLDVVISVMWISIA
ncbi:hypothetical protein K490DRAFT_67000 [Saccharata proteae CBS 121410]|uniref:Dynein light chain n=1 Tax=Saccharata proteae CBS 121410 TaxID=1314787 RepID=A0A9P4HU67_9PEZI|nr:hypothetical protein K490DRAFT_67000 [Saccharata proteae CBS 121410]